MCVCVFLGGWVKRFLPPHLWKLYQGTVSSETIVTSVIWSVCTCWCVFVRRAAVKDTDRHTCSFMIGPAEAPLGHNVREESKGELWASKGS